MADQASQPRAGNAAAVAAAGATLQALPEPRLLALRRDVYEKMLVIVELAGQRELQAVGVSGDVVWDAARPDVQRIARERSKQLFDSVFQTAGERARAALVEELAKAQTPFQIADALRERLGGVSKRQAEMAVRSEVRDLYNEATLDAWELAGMTHVKASDGHGGLTGRTDADCLARNGKTFTIPQARKENHSPVTHPRCTLSWSPIVPKGGLQPDLAAAFDEALHPRAPARTREGGRFVKKLGELLDAVTPRFVPGFLDGIQRWTDSPNPNNDFGSHFKGEDLATDETNEFGTALVNYERYPNRGALARAHDLDGITSGPYGIEGPFFHEKPDGPVIYINWLHNGTPTGSNPHEDNTVIGGNPKDFIKLVNWIRSQNAPVYAAFINGPLRDLFLRRFRSDLDLSLSPADLLAPSKLWVPGDDLALAWDPELHPRWPENSPFGKGGEFMEVGDLASILKRLPSHTMDVSFLSRGAQHITRVEAISPSDTELDRVAFVAHINHPTTGDFEIGLILRDTADVSTSSVQRALSKLDQGAARNVVINEFQPGQLLDMSGDTFNYRRYRALIGGSTLSGLSDRFDLHSDPARRSLDGSVEARLEAIIRLTEQVHLHDGAPATVAIPLTLEPELPDWGRFTWAAHYGRAVSMAINPEAPEFTQVVHHEIGHYVDRQLLGQNYFESIPDMVSLTEDGQPVRAPAGEFPEMTREMRAVLDQIEQSAAYEHLRSLLDGEPRHVSITLDDGTEIEGDAQPDVVYAAYNARLDESFARAYAQWIALRTGDEEAIQGVLDQLEGGVSQHRTGMFYGRHWEWADFAAIAAAMDELFASYGLLRPEARGKDPARLLGGGAE